MNEGEIHLNEKERIFCIKTRMFNWTSVLMLIFWFCFTYAVMYGVNQMFSTWTPENENLIAIFLSFAVMAIATGIYLKKGYFHKMKHNHYKIVEGNCH